MTTPNFGHDTSCTTSLRTGRLVSGVRLIAEAIYRRLTTPRGALLGDEDEKNYGLDLFDLVGSVATKRNAAALPGRIRQEVTKDERIDTCTVNVDSVTNGPKTTWTITIACTTALGPFTLVVGVNDVTTQLLNIDEAA